MSPRIVAIILLTTSFFNAKSQSHESKLLISHLAGDFYIFTTYNLYKGVRIPANGLYVVSTEGVVLIDSPWDTTQFQPLLDTIFSRHNKPVVLCVATHFHEDRTGGLEYYRQKGIKTYTTRLTDEWSTKRGMKHAEFLVEKDSVFTVGQYSFQTYYPGHGHTPDNIVIWFPHERILYGGCLIKSWKDGDLGNLADASISDYAKTVQNVKMQCKDPLFVVPGHNDWTSPTSLDHTLKMARELQRGN